MAGFYSFIRGISGKLGTGTQDLGFQRSSSIPNESLTGPGMLVRRNFRASNPGYVKQGQSLVPVPMLGTTGLSLHGTPTLGQLAQKGTK